MGIILVLIAYVKLVSSNGNIILTPQHNEHMLFINYILDINAIYIEDDSMGKIFTIDSLHDFLIKYTKSVKVGVDPYPFIEPSVSINNKLVESHKGDRPYDLLFALPRF